MTLLKLFFPVFVALRVAAGIEYTDDGIAIVGTTEPLTVDVTAGTSREDLISYEFASYIAVHFAGFNLPDGDSVVITSPDNNSTAPYIYTGRGRDQSGTFIASFIPGNSVTVTYKSVGAATTGQGYRITGFSRGYPTMRQESICGDGDQSLPAKCYAPGSNLSETLPLAYKKAQAVARLLINGTYMCTGWLGGSEGHLFTNKHCFEQEDWALSTDIEFAAESSSCSDQCETQLGCAGKIVATTSTFIAGSADIDYSVVKLPDCVDLSPYGYLQLRESGPVVNESIYVPQHPEGYAKRIVSTVDNGCDTTIRSVGDDGDCGTDQVGHDADTQGGSSGSPLIASSDNLVVAIHHCGGCTNTAIDVRTVLTDLASKNITTKNLVASEDVGQSSQPLYAQTPCTAQYSTNSTHAGQNHTMPCRILTIQGSSKTALTTTASNKTTTATITSKMAASNITSTAVIATPSSTPAATTTSSHTSSLASPSPSSTSASTTVSSVAMTSSTAMSKSTAALTSASVVTSTKTTKITSAPSTATKASSTPVSAVTSSSSLNTTTMNSTTTANTTSTSTTAKTTKAATPTRSTSTPKPATPSPTIVSPTLKPTTASPTPTPSAAPTPKPSSTAAPSTTPTVTASPTPAVTVSSTPTPSSTTVSSSVTPAPTTATAPTATPASTLVTSSSGGWDNVKQN